jgi:Flp pilus assembly protein TadD
MEQPGAGVEVDYQLSRVLRRLRDDAAAAVVLREAVRREPGYAEAHADLGMVYIMLKRYCVAGRHLRLAAMLKPGWALPWSRLSVLYKMTGHDEAMLSALRYAVRLCPDDLPMRAYLEDLERGNRKKKGEG